MDSTTLSRTTTNVSSSTPSSPPTQHDSKTPNKFVRGWRRAYQWMGFQKGYNFTMYIIFAGAVFGFSLARLSYLNISGSSKNSYANGTSPGEWYWNGKGIHRIGITLHLGAILPAGLLMVWQFIPAIRHKFLLFHRINGYLIITLVLIGNVGALMIARRAFGGTLATQAAVGLLAIISTFSMAMAYYNIKRLQIDQHRAWMLRAMFYLGTIVTLRIIMILSALLASQASFYATIMTCGELNSIYDTSSAVNKFYPVCGAAGATKDTLAIVQAKFGEQPEQIASALRLSFGMAMWMAIFLHGVGVEIYLNLTPKENNRLRQVSYERQLERGFSPAGSAGLTSDRWGDAEAWQPEREGTEK
ncbi:MAG: hypothetical protein Q9168_007578 [Polycauliona sp. 1 TL-2023]